MGRKTNVWTFEATNKLNLTRENLDSAEKKGCLQRETESLRIAAKNNAIRTNCVKPKKQRQDKIADVNYVVIKMKPSIT